MTRHSNWTSDSLKARDSLRSEKKLNKDFTELRSNLAVVASWLSIFCLFFTNSVMAQAVGNGIARLPFGWLSDRTGKRVPFILLGLIIASLSAGLLASSAFQAAAFLGLIGAQECIYLLHAWKEKLMQLETYLRLVKLNDGSH